MEVKIKLVNLDDDVFQTAFSAAKVDMIENEGNVKALDDIPDVMVIDCFKLPNDVIMEVIANVISAYGVTKWMDENGLEMIQE